MILTEKHIDERKIIQLVGQEIKFDWRKRTTVGGTGLFLKSFENKTDGFEKLKVDSKCNFEKRTNGLLLHSNFSNKRTLIPIPAKEIQEIKIVRGKEGINPTPLYPMWILMKLGVSVLQARYFGLTRHQYSIEQMELSLKTKDYEMDFVANGFLFERKLEFLKSLELADKLVVVKKASR
ncbi:hypothetical protein [uncultured Winogradskyella sp.]|uniref:hypothetical protein n=1 Tax=uncultured Winogradskyella sp. TaxID=395353 RepID=UPI0030EF6B3B